MKEKYICRYDAEKGKKYTFVGWRLCITRRGQRFVRYFSDLEYGGKEKAHEAALMMRDAMLQDMENKVDDYREFFNYYRRMGRAE